MGVEARLTSPDSLEVGTPLTAVFYDEAGRPRAEKGDLYSEAPFFVSFDDRVDEHTLGNTALLLWKRGDEVMVADARPLQAEQNRDRTLLEMKVSRWSSCDERRNSPRRPCDASVALWVLQDDEPFVGADVVYGRCHDISEAGAFVEVARPMVVGQLVEYHTVLEGAVVKALSVVARRRENPDGYGIAFLEFLADGEDHLRRYLKRIA